MLIARIRRFFHCLFTLHRDTVHCAVDLRAGRGICLTCTCGKIFYLTDP